MRTPEIEIILPHWLSRKLKVTPILRGRITKETQKGIYFQGTIVPSSSDTCFRCGRELLNPLSRRVGYGPQCRKAMGICEKEIWDNKTLEEKLKRQLSSVKYSGWLPKKKVQVRYVS
ncbi:MAG: hypothetical protein AVO34_05065 [Firmicutes bacterium ML8_F2]|jgi:hypothetical protein|nr:MAG: hypothetical protein AVO34_05065 [Firmicutes bacterium ML8_F2]